MALRLSGHPRSSSLPWVTFAFLFGLATTAHATATISCGGIDAKADVDVLFGAGPVPSVLDVTFSVGSQMYSTQGREGMSEAVIARAYVDDAIMNIDLMDDQVSVHLASIRVLRFESEASGPFQIGYIRLRDQAPIGIMCDGP
ncbi:MAG: hypothetical protein AAF940_03470 [Pseudomonadota bacterium]